MESKIPLIGMNLSVSGEFNNWASKPNFSFAINLEMAYFNETLTAWEPVIEPVEVQGSGEEQFVPFELVVDMITSLEPGAESKMLRRKNAQLDAAQHISTTLNAQRSFNLHSSVPLQLVVTKTLFG